MKKIGTIAFLLLICLLLPLLAISVPAENIVPLIGDANEDGTVDVRDLILLRQYIAALDYDTGISTVTVSERADVNGDGIIRLQDICFLREYIANKSTNSTLNAQMKGKRPIIFETDEMLAASKQNVALRQDTALTSWQNVLRKANLAMDTAPAPYLGESATQYRLAACNDFINARSLALAYYHTNDAKYLDRAVEYLLAYAAADVMPGSDEHLDYSAATTDGKADIGLNIALPLTTACDVYSLLYPYMTNADKMTFEGWIRVEVELVKKGHQYWIDNDYYGDQIGNNHVTSHLMGLICAAYALEDDELLEYAVCGVANESNFLEMFDRAILMNGDKTYSADPSDTFTEGEIYDRYRVVSDPPNGFGYSLYHLKFLTYTALVMYNNGIDFFAYEGTNGENLLLPFKVYSEYLIKNDASLGNGYYAGNALNRESAYTLYLIADYVYDDDVVSSVVKTLGDDGVVPGDNEQFGRSGGYLFGLE